MDQVNTQPVPASQIPPPARSGFLKWVLIAGIAVVSISGIIAYTILRRSSSNTSTVVSNYSVSPSVVPVVTGESQYEESPITPYPGAKIYTSQKWGIRFQYSESGHGPYNIYEDENLISIGGNKDKKFDSIERFRIDSSRPEAELNRIIKLDSGFSEDKCLIDLSSVGEAKNRYIKATVVPKNGPHTDSCGKYTSFNSQPFFYHILGTEYLFFITKSGGSLAASETDTGIKAKSAYTIDGWPGTIEFLKKIN